MKSFHSDIQFENYVLREVHFKIDPKEDRNEILDFDFDPKIIIDEENEKAILGLNFKTSQYGNVIEGELLGFFSYKKDLKLDELENLLFINGTTLLLPYLRAIIGNISMIASVESIIIPTINVVEFLKDKLDRENNADQTDE